MKAALLTAAGPLCSASLKPPACLLVLFSRFLRHPALAVGNVVGAPEGWKVGDVGSCRAARVLTYAKLSSCPGSCLTYSVFTFQSVRVLAEIHISANS